MIFAALGLPKSSPGRPAELSLFFTDDAIITDLNLRYRGRKRPTNVLAFPLSEGEPGFLAEIVISLETAEREALRAGISREQRVRELLIHGILHLCGYDHEKPGEGRRMRKRERELAELIKSKNWQVEMTRLAR